MFPYTDRGSLALPVLLPLSCALLLSLGGAAALYTWYFDPGFFQRVLALPLTANAHIDIGFCIAGLALMLHLVPDNAPFRLHALALPVARLLGFVLLLLTLLFSLP